MTNAHTDENPFNAWRKEIQEFCDDIRRQLASISDRINAVESDPPPTVEDSTVASVVDDATVLPVLSVCEVAAANDVDPAIELASENESEAAETDANHVVSNVDEEPSCDHDASSTEDRLQTVRRQLQAMLDSVEA